VAGGGWRGLCNEGLHNLWASQNIVRVIKLRRIRWAGPVARMREVRHAYILVGRHEGKRTLGRPGRRWENHIRMDIRERGWEGMDWMNLAQDRDQCSALVSMVMKIEFHKRWGTNLRVP